MSDEVGLLFGGPARERLVSVASAQNLAELLPAPRCFFWAPDGAVFEIPRSELVAHARPFEVDLVPRDPARWRDIKTALAEWADRADRGLALFLALHGQMVEDGVLQGWLEERGIPFTGSGSRASRDAFDKARARDIASRAGLRVAEATVVEACDLPRARTRVLDLLKRFSRVVLKPVADGSSMGLRFVASAAELDEALAAIREEAHVYLAEAFVSGIELTVGVIDDDGDVLRALPCSEVRLPEGGAFGYEAKYLGRGAREITPAEVAPEVAAATQAAALAAHGALGCEGYSRTDVIVDAQGPVYLETNTLPGLTRASFLPQQLEAAGIPLPRFLARQLELARRRVRAS